MKSSVVSIHTANGNDIRQWANGLGYEYNPSKIERQAAILYLNGLDSGRDYVPTKPVPKRAYAAPHFPCKPKLSWVEY